jgi:hypothetical protein
MHGRSKGRSCGVIWYDQAMTKPRSLLVFLLALLLQGGCATTSKRLVITAAGVINMVDKTTAPLYSRASSAALTDPALLQLARSGPEGPGKALAEWRRRMEPWEKIRHAVNLGRAAILDAGAVIDAAAAPDRERQALLATAGSVSLVADILRALPGLGVAPSPWLKSTADALCLSAEALLAGQQPPIPAPCAAAPPAPPGPAPAPAAPAPPST